jgi:hypothetical protein
MHNGHSRNALVDWLASPFLPGVRFNGDPPGLDNRRISGNLSLFKQALLIRVGVFLAAFPEPLVEKESVLLLQMVVSDLKGFVARLDRLSV